MKRTPDVQRVAAALSTPGIDPRTWSTLAIVTAVKVDKIGVHVDITTVMGLEESATLAPIYGGDGFGFYTPIGVGDAVVVVFPEGEFSLGGRIVGRAWDQADPPPAAVVDHPDDVVLVVRDGTAMRINVSGGGKLYLGDVTATEPVVLGTTYRTAEDALVAALQALILALDILVTAMSVDVALLGVAPNTYAAAGVAQVAFVPMFQALTKFFAQGPTYLSKKVTVG